MFPFMPGCGEPWQEGENKAGIEGKSLMPAEFETLLFITHPCQAGQDSTRVPVPWDGHWSPPSPSQLARLSPS